MQSLRVWTVMCLLFQSAVFSKAAAFSALYAFGDGVCTTTGNNSGLSYYYPNSYCNGRIWIQVLAQRQGLAYIASNNDSFYGQYSINLVTNVTSFIAPTNVSSALFLIWVSDADLVSGMQTINPLSDTNQWAAVLNQSLVHQTNAIQILYNKGVRTLVMPNAVDITEIPSYNHTAAATRVLIRAQIAAFNSNFLAAERNLVVSNLGLAIYVPDIFSLLDNVLTNAAGYGMTNVLSGGQTIDALHAGYTGFTSPGANFIFWDPTDPTARFHEVIGDYIQNLISPAQITSVTPMGASNQLNIVNFPAGLNGYVDAGTNANATNWQSVQFCTNAGTTTSIYLPMTGQQQYYRLRFPYAWYWP
jgi:phospholipase/lecithinase/hemolysin